MRSKEIDALQNISSSKKAIHSDVSGFIPISCHYDNSILITKNSDLVLSISIGGFSEGENKDSIKDRVRNLILASIDTYKIAVNITVIRDYQNISPKGIIPFGMPATLNRAWTKHNNWESQLVNRLYITLIYQGVANSDSQKKKVSLRSKLDAYWAEASQKLHLIADHICDSLKDLQSHKLGILETKNGAVSEPLSFYHYLTHLEWEQRFVPTEDLADHLSNINIDYRFNYLRINEDQGRDKYASVYTLKEVPDAPDEIYSSFLQVPMKFIATETLIFTSRSNAKKTFEDKFELLQMGRDEALANRIGLSSIFNADQNNIADYCLNQINFLVYDEDQGRFENAVNMVSKIWQEVGIIAVREDFNMARCFWSMLPGNSKFLCRAKHNATLNALNLASIHDTNCGSVSGSKWGDPITLFPTLKKSAFYFNFHVGDNGHTLILGPYGNGKTTLGKFLLAQSIKLDPRIIYIDLRGEAEGFIVKMGGDFVSIQTESESPIKISPLNDELFFKNKEWMEQWVHEALIQSNEQNKKNAKQFAGTLVDNILSLTSQEERQKAFSEIINGLMEKKSTKLLSGVTDPKIHQNLFDEDQLEVILDNSILGINLAEITPPELRNSFLKLLLLKLANMTFEEPTIILINQTSSLLEEGYFSDLMPRWMELITSKNALSIMELASNKKIEHNKEFQNIINQFSTKLFTTDHLADKNFKYAYDLDEDELRKIKTYTPEHRMFLIKQGDISTMASFYMEDMRNILEGK